MTDLQVRRIPFRFDESVPFQWLPTNPDFGAVANAIGVIAVAFEKYIVAVVRRAMPRLTDPAVVAEADAFLRQEAQHARAHRLHLNALVARYPGLASTIDEAVASYDRLLDEEPLEFHVAYIAALEATFTPLFTMMLDTRHDLFDPGDARVASLFAWHFVEEIEHRSSALTIYHAVVADPRYRLRVAWRVGSHVLGVYATAVAGFERHVPPEDRLVDAGELAPGRLWQREVAVRLPVVGRRLRRRGATAPFHAVPTGRLAVMTLRLLRSQAPGHRPAGERLPRWADTWFAAYDRGADMTTFVGARPAVAS